MLDEKVIDIVRRIFFDHDCIMTTAELNSYKLYYADIQKLLDEGQLSFIIIIAIVILPNGILRLIKMFQGIVQR